MEAQTLHISRVYKAITRTASIYGIAYDYFVLEIMISGIAFIYSVPYVLVIVPLHIAGIIAYKIDPQFFKVIRVKSRFAGQGNRQYWGGKTYDAS